MKTVDAERIVPETMVPHAATKHVETVRVTAKDEFGDWVASHKKEVKGMICGMSEYKDAPFCPRTRTRSGAKKKGL